MTIDIIAVRRTGPLSVRWSVKARDGSEAVFAVADTSNPTRGHVVVHDIAGFDGAPVTLALRNAILRRVEHAASAWRVSRNLDHIHRSARTAAA